MKHLSHIIDIALIIGTDPHYITKDSLGWQELGKTDKKGRIPYWNAVNINFKPFKVEILECWCKNPTIDYAKIKSLIGYCVYQKLNYTFMGE
jgi:hypothetical protein